MLDALIDAAEHARKQPISVRLEIDPLGIRVQGYAKRNSYSSIVSWQAIAQSKVNILALAIDHIVKTLHEGS